MWKILRIVICSTIQICSIKFLLIASTYNHVLENMLTLSVIVCICAQNKPKIDFLAFDKSLPKTYSLNMPLTRDATASHQICLHKHAVQSDLKFWLGKLKLIFLAKHLNLIETACLHKQILWKNVVYSWCSGGYQFFTFTQVLNFINIFNYFLCESLFIYTFLISFFFQELEQICLCR